MKSKSKTSPRLERYSMIEPLEQRIAPASTATVTFGALLPANPTFVTATAGGALLMKAGDVLTTAAGGGGSYLLYVQAGEVLVHTTDLNSNNVVDFNEITGLSVGNGARFTSFVDIHGDIVTDLNPDGTLSDGGKGDILLDANIAAIDMRSLETGDFAGNSVQSSADLVSDHLAMTNYSIFGNIYAGGGLGVANDTTSGLHLNPNEGPALENKFNGVTSGSELYAATEPVVGSIYAGTAASGQSFTFGSSGHGTSAPGTLPLDIQGNLLAFNPAPGEAGASIYNIQADAPGIAFSIGTIQAGNGGFNAPGGNVVNVALDGDNSGVYKLIAGNAGNGTVGQPGGSIINFSEAGAFISEVVLQSGSGGSGLTGKGGNAGTITLNPANPIEINAHLVLNYGNGGDGYTGGGNGGGTTKGNFVTPEGKITQPQNLVTTAYTMGAITPTPFDFNGDGLSDAVFSTTSPNQVVVALGQYTPGSANTTATATYGLNYSQYIYLNAPAQVDSIVVADFTGAVNPVTHQPEYDIAVASGQGSYAGIEVFISEYNPKTGAFEGFSDPLFTPLPILSSYNYYDTSFTISKLMAGNFSGNGVMGLAALVQETTDPAEFVDNVLIFLNGEVSNAHPTGSGYFYANFANGNQPFVDLSAYVGNATQSTFIATPLVAYTPGATAVANNTHDVVLFADLGDTGFGVVDDSTSATATSKAPVFLAGGGWGAVWPPGSKTPVQFYDQTFTVFQDFQNPNIADVAAVSSKPQGFIVTEQGNGAGQFTVSTPQIEFGYYGIDFGYGTGVAPQAIVTVPSTAGPTKSGLFQDLAILDYDANGGDYIWMQNLFYDTVNFPPSESFVWANTDFAILATITPAGGTSTEVAFGAFYPHPQPSSLYVNSGPGEYGFITGDPLTNYAQYTQGLGINQPLGAGVGLDGLYTNYVPFKNAGYFFNGGDGGNSLSGPGGAGGSFGSSLTLSTANGLTTGTGTLAIEFPADVTYEGVARFIGGNGGNGFTNGGAGGNLIGISLSYNNATELTGNALLFAGNGGESLTATGGAGGSLSQLYIVSGELFVGGNGGIGIYGGSGGSLKGNSGSFTGETNNYDSYVALRGGSGANGILGGGAGGSINSWVEWFGPLINGTGGLLNYVGGNGGDAVAGQGGSGGSVINASPYVVDNNLAGNIYLQGGAGGTGKYGGNGGGVNTFDNIPTINSSPLSLTVIGGDGGAATIGTGGAGGGISNVVASATGNVVNTTNAFEASALFTFNFTNPSTDESIVDAVTGFQAINYNRLVAGYGGASAGGVGGLGGAVSTIQSAATAQNGQEVVSAGAGGTGLIGGGAGGGVTSANINAGSTSGKVLIIAGDGGATLGARPADPHDPIDINYSNGGSNGAGGNGGSIIGFTQPLTVNTHVDLIAGNGGATPNHSVAVGNATTDNSGRGGSIENINVAGSIGAAPAADANIPIISYNNIFTGVTANGIANTFTMQQFVDNYILGDPTAALTDAIGNVGLVAGAAGMVDGGLLNGGPSLAPSTSGVNGSVTNIQAENIMSMVAGNVYQVSLIQDLTQYGITVNGGVLGSSKAVWYNPESGMDQTTISGVPLGNPNQLNYISPNGGYSTTPLPGGGELVDGAFIAMNIRTIESIRDFQGTEST